MAVSSNEMDEMMIQWMERWEMSRFHALPCHDNDVGRVLVKSKAKEFLSEMSLAIGLYQGH